MDDMEQMAQELIRLRATDLTEQELIEAASSPLEVVRAAVASHPNTPKDTLLELVDDYVFEVVVAVAHNATAYREVSQALLNLENDEIREHVLGCGVPTIAHLAVASSGSYDDVFHMLQNKEMDRRTLNRVYKRALNQEFGACRDDEVLRMLISHPNTDADVKQEIYVNGNPALACFFAASVLTPVDILEDLLTHPDPMVRLLVGMNPSLPLHLQDQYQAETGVSPRLFRAVTGLGD